MIWVALIGLPVLILFFTILLFGVSDTDVPGGKTPWNVSLSLVLLVLSASFITHLMEVL